MRRVASRRFDFAHSRHVRAFVVASHAASGLLVAALPLDVPLIASLMLLVASLGAWAWRHADSRLAGMVVRSDGTVVALGRDGRATDGSLVGGAVALPRLATIAWRATGERRVRHEPVPSDRLGGEAHRELRVLLRYAMSGEVAGEPASQARASIINPLSALDWPARR